MKKKQWLEAMSLADDQFVEEADPARHTGSRGIWILAGAVCAVLVLVCSLWLFVPYSTQPPDVSMYAGSQYYDIIQKFNVLNYVPPRYKNNAQWLQAQLNSGLKDTEPEDWHDTSTPEMSLPGQNQEITDNQVQGVIEGDRIKRTDNFIFYLDGPTLKVFSIAGEKSARVGEYTPEFFSAGNGIRPENWAFYLSGDGKTVTLVSEFYSTDKERFVGVSRLNVANPASIHQTHFTRVTGKYISSRMTDDRLLLVTEFAANLQGMKFDREETYLPQVDSGDGPESIPSESIVAPEKLENGRYTVVMKFGANTLEPEGSAAYLSYSDVLYVSKEHVFLTRPYALTRDTGSGNAETVSMTEIAGLSFAGDAFRQLGTVAVEGTLKDQWSMDVYDGILRVVTTTRRSCLRPLPDGNRYQEFSPSKVNANLYCIDLAKMAIVASEEQFAPPGEQVRSVRFDGPRAYVCTSVERRDPVFFFDLSDIQNITWKNTGTIAGFSTSLVNIGNGFLLGIGLGGNGGLKIEIYEETGDAVRSVCCWENPCLTASLNYKSYYIDRQHRLLGMGVRNNDKNETEYLLFHFDGYDLLKLAQVALAGDPSDMRGVCVDGYLYLFGSRDFKTEKLK